MYVIVVGKENVKEDSGPQSLAVSTHAPVWHPQPLRECWRGIGSMFCQRLQHRPNFVSAPVEFAALRESILETRNKVTGDICGSLLRTCPSNTSR